MSGLPKSYIKKYGVSKKAWRLYKQSKNTKNKSRSLPSMRMPNKTGTKRRKATDITKRIYNKTEKSIGASRIVERVLNTLKFPGEPWTSLITTGVGFSRGGIVGGLASAAVSSNLLEMALDRFGGASAALVQGQPGTVQGL